MRIRQEISPRELAKGFRKQETEAEKELWRYLRSRRLAGYKFYRQYPVGDYIADFCCRKPLLVIELDGSPHLTSREKDQARTLNMKAKGYTVLRFWNSQVLKKTPVVLDTIIKVLNDLT